MKDYVVRAAAANAQIRAFAATTRDLAEEARSRHHAGPVAAAALGRLLTAGAMMGTMLKGEEDLLTLQIAGDGPIGRITVTADAKARVKGYADHPEVMLPPNRMGKLDVGGAVGRGTLRVFRDMGLKEPYVGQTALQTGEIAEDLTYYFAASEQIPSSVGLGVLMNQDNTVKQAGGFIIQLMPFAEEGVLAALEENLSKITSVTQMLDEGNTPEKMLERILGNLDLEITDRVNARFSCNCEKSRVEKTLISIGEKELEDMIREGKPVEVNCHFCNTDYCFSVEELKELLKRSKR